MRLALSLICLTIGRTNALVEFTNSALYDGFDFDGVEEVIHIKKCDSGCVIFAAVSEGNDPATAYTDPIAMNLLVVNNDEDKSYSFAELSKQHDDKMRKIPLIITGMGNISVVNRNDLNADQDWPIVLFVVDKLTAEKISYEVYDPFYTSKKNNDATLTLQSDIVTFISAYSFRIRSDPSTQPNSITARLAGFDNALDGNEDGCPFAYKTPDGLPSFPGFSIMTSPPMLSVAVGKKGMELQTEAILPSDTKSCDEKSDEIHDITVDGLFSSPGWNGCTKPTSGGLQAFRYTDCIITHKVLTPPKGVEQNFYKVTLDVLPNFDSSIVNHELEIFEKFEFANYDEPIVVTGTQQRQIAYAKTNYLSFEFHDMYNDQGFLVRYSSRLLPIPTTPVTSLKESSITTPESQTTGLVSSTSTTPPNKPTTTTGVPNTVISSTLTTPVTSPRPPVTTSSGFIPTGALLSLVCASLLIH